MFRTLLRTLAAIALGSCFAAGAAPTTFGFTGSLTDDPFGISTFGAPITGSFTFDSAAVDSIPGPAGGSYTSVGPGFGLSITLDGQLYELMGSLNVGVQPGTPGPAFYTVTAGDPLSLLLELVLTDTSGTALGSDALLTSPPTLADFDVRRIRVFGVDDLEFAGDLTTLECVGLCEPNGGGVVPEPGSLGLVAGAALLAAAARRRRGAGAAVVALAAWGAAQAVDCTSANNAIG